MKLLILASLLVLAIAGCSTINVTASCPSGSNGRMTINIEQPKTVTAAPSMDGNTVPVSAVP